MDGFICVTIAVYILVFLVFESCLGNTGAARVFDLNFID